VRLEADLGAAAEVGEDPLAVVLAHGELDLEFGRCAPIVERGDRWAARRPDDPLRPALLAQAAAATGKLGRWDESAVRARAALEIAARPEDWRATLDGGGGAGPPRRAKAALERCGAAGDVPCCGRGPGARRLYETLVAGSQALGAGAGGGGGRGGQGGAARGRGDPGLAVGTTVGQIARSEPMYVRHQPWSATAAAGRLAQPVDPAPTDRRPLRADEAGGSPTLGRRTACRWRSRWRG
jgi:hypothetical protein